jgi:fucose permease
LYISLYNIVRDWKNNVNPQKAEVKPVLLLIISYLVFIGMAIPDGVLNIAWTYMQQTFGLPPSGIGPLLGCAMVARLISSFGSGPLIARFGMGNLLLSGIVLVLAGVLLVTFAAETAVWWMLFVAIFVLALGGGALDGGLNTFVSANYSTGRLNWLHAAFGIGITIGPWMATYIIVSLQSAWQWAYVVSAVPVVILLGLLFFTRSAWTAQAQAPNAAVISSQRVSMRETLSVPMVLLSLLLFFTYGGAEFGPGQLANTLFVEQRGIDQGTSGFWVGMFWAMFTLGRVLMGAVADRVSNTLLLRWSMIGTVIGGVLLWFNPVNEVGFIGLALMGFAFAPMFATLISETPRRVGMRYAANTIGFQIGVSGLGGAVLPGITAAIAGQHGYEVIAPLLLFFCIVLLVIHEVILWHENRTAQLKNAEASAD